jgi:hypothetical protein
VINKKTILKIRRTVREELAAQPAKNPAEKDRRRDGGGPIPTAAVRLAGI